jgi:DNA polymerase-3 subunit alpha
MIGEIVTECRRMNIPVLPPDVNESFSQFTVVKMSDEAEGAQEVAQGELAEPSEARTVAKATEQQERHQQVPTPVEEGKLPLRYRIRFGMVTIKNFGQSISTAIIEERKRGGKFKSLADFLTRVKDRNLNKKSLEALIKSGALDCFGEDRGIMLTNLEHLIDFNKDHGSTHADQDSLFGLMSDTSTVPTLRLTDAPKAEMALKLAWEKELLGLYVSGHPLERFREIITKKDINIQKAKDGKEGSSAILAIIINGVRAIQTKKNETMAFVTIADFSGTSDAVVFPRTYREFKDLIQPDTCLAIKATLNVRNGEKSFVIDRMKRL